MPGMKNKLISSAVAAAAVAMALSAGALVNARSSSRKQQDAAPTPAAQHANSRANAMPFVVPDLADRAAKFKVVRMPFHAKGLSKKEIEMVDKLVDAAGLADCIYWRQSDPDGLKLYLALAHDNSPNALLLRRYLKINGSRLI